MQRDRAGPFAVVAAEDEPLAAVALAEEGVFLAGEIAEHLVVGEAAAVVADVEDDAFLVEVIGIKGPDEASRAPARSYWGCGYSRAGPSRVPPPSWRWR